MKIRSDILYDKTKTWTADDFRLPETLAQVPDEAQVILDGCFQSISGLLDHSLAGLAAEGIPKFPGYGILTGLAQNGLIRAGVETRADEMTRKWGKLVGSDDADKLAKLEHEFNRYKIPAIFNRAAALCGYYGGCMGFIDTGEGRDSWANPLILTRETFEPGSFRGIKIIEPYTVTPAGYNSVNPMADDYFKPVLWYVQGIPVHTTRMLYFAENDLPTLLKPAYNFFGLSLSQKVMDAVAHYTSLRENANRLMEKYALTVFKTDMTEVLSGNMDQTLAQRVQYFINMRNNDGCAAIDRDKEDIVVMTTSMAGVTDLVRQAQEYVAAMFCEPVTKMWGLSPSGFSTGDSDLRNHYDNISSLQEKIFNTPMARVVRLLQLNKFGIVDPSISFEFAPLSDEDENTKISTAKTKCDMNVAYMEAGVLAPEEVRKSLINDPDSGYDGLDEELPKGPQGGGEELSPFDPNENPEGEEGPGENPAEEKPEETKPTEKQEEKSEETPAAKEEPKQGENSGGAKP